jgi:hypothetical protein
MAISLKARVSRNEVRLISVRDEAIDWEKMATGAGLSVPEAKTKYSNDRDPSFLAFKEGHLPTVFVFNDPRNATSHGKMQNLLIGMSGLAEGKSQVDSNRVVWEELYVGSFDGIWDGSPSPVNRDKRGHLNDAYIQALIDAGVYMELALAIVAIFSTSIEGGSVSEDSKSPRVD